MMGKLRRGLGRGRTSESAGEAAPSRMTDGEELAMSAESTGPGAVVRAGGRGAR